jgi:hypothetical protein
LVFLMQLKQLEIITSCFWHKLFATKKRRVYDKEQPSSVHLNITYFYHPLNFVPVFSEGFFIKVVIAGIFFGICSTLLIEILRLGNVISKKLKF